MPEGDTIFRAARALGRILAGMRITSFESPLPALARADSVVLRDTPANGTLTVVEPR